MQVNQNMLQNELTCECKWYVHKTHIKKLSVMKKGLQKH